MDKPIVILPGWGNTVNELYKLRTTLDIFSNNIFLFDYSYEVPEDEIDTDTGIYAPFDTMKDRFYKYLGDNNLLNDEIDVFGFSEGGIIALYTSGLKNDILINRYISVASPHHGAYSPNFFWFHDNDSVTKQLEWESDFMKDNGVYETASFDFFAKYEKNNLLQIYSEKDKVATPDSALRFKDKMQVFEVTDGFKWHNALPTNNSVIKEIVSFLS